MGQVSTPVAAPSIILSAVDRLVASNADGGLGITVEHVILLGEDAGQNLNTNGVIALGAQTLDGGLSDPNAAGTVGIGRNAGSAMQFGTVDQANGPSVVIGPDAAANARYLPASVVIGASALKNFTNSAAPSSPPSSGYSLVVIGHQALENGIDDLSGGFGVYESVVIGRRALRMSGAGRISAFNNVVMGSRALQSYSPANTSSLFNNVVIGYSAAPGMGSGSENVFIGANVCAVLFGEGNSRNVVIGAGATLNGNGGGGTAVGNVIIGDQAAFAPSMTGDNNVLIGRQVGGTDGSRNIRIGQSSGNDEDVSFDDRLIIETFDGITRRGAMYADMSKGSVILGTVPLASRNLPGTNIVKLLNGTTTGAAPVGGGYFLVEGGELSWVSSANARTVLSAAGGLTVATLPVGFTTQRAFVTDALAPAFGAAVVGGGAVFVPVYFDGTIWRVG